MNIKRFIKRILAPALIPVIAFPLGVSAEETEICTDEYEYEEFPGYHEIDVEVEQVDLSEVFADSVDADYSGGTPTVSDVLPSRYDPLSDPSINYLPKLHNQSPYGTCWAHSSISLAEINLIKQGLADKTIDLSELQLAFFSYNFVTDPLGGTAGDLNTSPESYRKKAGGLFNVGGNLAFSSNVLASWVGAAPEEGELTYGVRDDLNKGEARLADEYAYDHDVAVLTDYYIAKYDINDLAPVKNLIYEYGAVSASMITNSKYYDSAHNSYYNYSQYKTDHAVTLVGWDDDFSRYDFKKTPDGDGAWLVRNSWNMTDDEESYHGYFWISYYDMSIKKNPLYAFKFDNTGKYDSNYQYDGGMWKKPSDYTTGANVFCAHANPNEDDDELIKAVSFGTDGANVEYTIDIYTDLKEGTDDPESGIHAASQTGKTTYAGYTTVELDDPLRVNENETFSVVVRLDTGEGKIYREYPAPSSTEWVNLVTAADDKCSFVYSGGEWKDYGRMTDSNLCIKAFTSNVAAEPYYYIAYHDGPEDGEVIVDDSRHYATCEYALDDSGIFEREGYEIAGWNTMPDGSGTSFEPGGTVIGLSEIKKDTVDLYAEWKGKTYDLTLDANNGCFETSDRLITQVTYGQPYGDRAVPVRSGYDFAGWSTGRYSGTLVGPEDIVDTAQDHTLYAGWSARSILLNFDPGEGALKETEMTKTVVNGSYYGALPVPVYEGNDFAGWYTEESDTLITGTDRVMSDSDMTLNAKWVPDLGENISDVPVKTVRLGMTKCTVGINESVTIPVSVYPVASAGKISYKLSGTATGTIDSGNGAVSFTAGNIPGTCKLTAVSQNGKKSVCTITVSSANTLSVSSKSRSVGTDATIVLGAYLGDRKLPPATVEWKIDEEGGCACIGSGGVLTGVSEGKVRVYAQNLATGKVSEGYEVNVSAGAAKNTGSKTAEEVRSITLMRGKRIVTGLEKMAYNKKVSFSAVLKDRYGKKTKDQKVIWTSDDPGVACVSRSGKLKAVSCGTTVIRASSVQSPDIADSFEITVYMPVGSIKADRTKITVTSGDGLTSYDVLGLDITPDDTDIESIDWKIVPQKSAMIEYGTIPAASVRQAETPGAKRQIIKDGCAYDKTCPGSENEALAIRGLSRGTVKITAVITDKLGNKKKAVCTVKVI